MYTTHYFICYGFFCVFNNPGEKFRLCNFDANGEEDNDHVRECSRFKIQSNKETKFVDIGMLRMDGANNRTVVFYPKSKL